MLSLNSETGPATRAELLAGSVGKKRGSLSVPAPATRRNTLSRRKESFLSYDLKRMKVMKASIIAISLATMLGAGGAAAAGMDGHWSGYLSGEKGSSLFQMGELASTSPAMR